MLLSSDNSPVASASTSFEPVREASTLHDYFSSKSSTISSIPESEDTWGDSVHDDPGDLHRVYFQNVDGIRNDMDEIALCISSMAQIQVGTFCWADPGLALSQPSVHRSISSPLRSHFPTVRSAFSSSVLPASLTLNSSYQNGGTFMATTGKWTTRSAGKPLVDPSGLGRWSGLSFLGKGNRRLAILTAYRSPRQQPTGGFGFFDQQYALLLSQGVCKPNVRKQFVTDIIHFINDLQQDGHDVILAFDANETVCASDTNGLCQIMNECSLLDLHSLGPSTPPATYKYGHHRRIDFILGTSAVSQSVRRAGFLAYDSGIFSKHRGIFVDLDFDSLMGEIHNIPAPSARRLQSENQLSVDRYLHALKQYATDHNVWQRITELTTVAPSMTAAQCAKCYDAIDRDVTRGMLHAEKMSKRPTGKYAWSPKLRESGLLARYWHLRLKEIERDINLRHVISALKTKIQDLQIVLVDDLTIDATIVRTRWKTALKLLRKVRNNAYDYRAVHLVSMLEMYKSRTTSFAPSDEVSSDDNKAKTQRIQRLINIECMRQPFRRIHSSVSNNSNGGLSKLYVPVRAKDPKVAARFCRPDGTITPRRLTLMAQADKTSVDYDVITDSERIHVELIYYNRNWFSQASETPFGHGELFDLVGYDGLTEAADAVIEGECMEYMGVPMSRELQVFLEECKRPEAVLPVSTDISLEDFKKTVKDWKESTSTSPSGRHLGHYKASLLDDKVGQMHTDMLNIPITYGFAPTRWTHSVTPLIEKDEGKPYLTRLRVIHLFEADYNLFLKLLFGRRLVRNAENANALNDQQHGSRPRRMTTDALFLARLEKDLIRQTKTNSAHMDNDATGCYDRIIISLGMMACRRLGMPTNAIRCQAEALQKMKYTVKTMHGLAPLQYNSSDSSPLFGTGQGSGASPAIWLSLVVVLLNALDRMSAEDSIPGLSFQDPWGEFSAAWRVGAFVDDTNQGVLDSSHNLSPEELVEQLRKAGQMWENLLHISGGSLNLAKCSWTMQFWDWKNGRPFLRPYSSMDPLLLMKSGSNPEEHIIRRHSNETEVKGLGVYMNFLGTFSSHAKTMKVKFDSMARRLSHSRLTPVLARLFYNSFYLPSVKYSLPVTSMTSDELHRIQSRMTASILNLLGYNKHYPHAVAFAPQSLFGCGLSDLRLEQGLSQIQSLLDYVGTDHKVGTVMIISLRNLQTEAGVSYDLLRHPTSRLPYLTDCWLLSVRRFCADHNISFQVKSNRLPLLARDGDSFLMESALAMGFKPQELKDINLVRSFVGVTTVSDLATANGTNLVPAAWSAMPMSDRISRLKFARQCAPTSYQKGLWRRLLRNLLIPGSSATNLKLRNPLSHWIAESNMQWGAMVWDSNLYRRNPFHDSGERNVAIYFPKVIGSTIYYDNKPDWYSATIPKLAVPSDLAGDQVLTATYDTLAFEPLPEPAATFTEWLAQLPPAEKRLVSSVFFSQCDAESVLVQYLQLDCTVYIGTDGGKKFHSGSFSWMICSPGREKLVMNAGPVDGWFKCQTSLRSEAAALASVTLYLDEMAAYYSIKIQCQFLLYVDSSSAITNVEQLRDLIPKRRFPDNADVLYTMKAAHHVLRHFRLEHIKSHQDDKVKYDNLPFPAQLNVLCDRMASNQLKRQRFNDWECTQSCALPTRTLPIEVFFGTQTISSHYVSNLRAEISADRHRNFLQMKYNWSDQTWVWIAHESMALCAKRTTLNNAPNRSKLVHNWLNLGLQRAKITKDAPPLTRCCPFCSLPEDFEHLLSCAHPKARKAQYDATLVLRRALEGPPAAAALLRAVKQWTLHPTDQLRITPGVLAYEPAIARALHTQQSIGWTNFFRGFLSLDWGYICSPTDTTPPTERYFRATNLVAKFIKAIQDYSLALWASRNAALHDNSVQSKAITQAPLKQDIEKLYDLRLTFSPILQSYFSLPLEDRLRRPSRHKQRWLHLARLATSHASAKGNRQQVISTYFPYAPRAEVSLLDPVPPAPVPTVVLPIVPPILQQLPLQF